MTGNAPALLKVQDLEVQFATRAGVVQALRGVSLSVRAGETLGLVGESGSGKSVTSQAIMGLIDPPGYITGGDILWRGQSLVGAKGSSLGRSVWGKEISTVFQDPMTSLNPLMTVGAQICEVLRHHLKMSSAQARRRAEELLDAVGISAPRRRLDEYPHELSGGMRQRVMIATAIACEPSLLIADEPTTALDVTIQAQIIELLTRLQRELGLAIIFITHDLGVIAGLCHRTAVMYAGRIVETGTTDYIFDHPAHPYTQGLLRSTPSLDTSEGDLLYIDGMPPRLINPPEGCAFRPRCPINSDVCGKTPTLAITDGGTAACWHAMTPAWEGMKS
ncbi:ABC transporter ATP-binding protein [Nitratireductor sp. GISD-1A_MAKvit]|uniref:ABC transporter ATP-binding protein n=1 Tax=Nitratireductor sp. GISD-1A_MAKvit TaxID=3234198 RepID=UPI003467C25A